MSDSQGDRDSQFNSANNTPIPSIDWSSIIIPTSTTNSTNSGNAIPNIDWSSLNIPGQPQLPRASTRPKEFNILTSDNRFPTFDEFYLMTQNPHFISELITVFPGIVEALTASEEVKKKTFQDLYSFFKLEQASRAFDTPGSNSNVVNAPDLMDPDIQTNIEENIRRANIKQSMEMAIEHTPEMFGKVEMLYISCKVNGNPIVAFVDSGAQNSFISLQIAEKCGLMRLIDESFMGMARGVGQAPILGKIHLTQLEIEGSFLPCSFFVMNQTADLLFGLDMLKRHQCMIDLERNILTVKSAGVETRFLSQAEVPEEERMFVSGTDTAKDDAVVQESANEADELEDRQITDAISKSQTDANSK